VKPNNALECHRAQRSKLPFDSAGMALPVQGLLAQQQGVGRSQRVGHGEAGRFLRPFNAHFVDVADTAGLRAPSIHGDEDAQKYIIESTGCGCAFIDCDHAG